MVIGQNKEPRTVLHICNPIRDWPNKEKGMWFECKQPLVGREERVTDETKNGCEGDYVSDEDIKIVQQDTRDQAKGPGFFRHRAG